MKDEYPDIPISQRHSQTAYERDEFSIGQVACYIAAITAVLVAFAVAMEVTSDHGQRVPTQLGGSDRPAQ